MGRRATGVPTGIHMLMREDAASGCGELPAQRTEGTPLDPYAWALGTSGSPLQAAIADPELEPLDPRVLSIPTEVVETFASARRALLLVHQVPPPDGDAVGSALGLLRGLRAQGISADIGIDEPLPGFLRQLVHLGEITPSPELRGPYDLVALLDVNEPGRAGPAASFFPQASTVLVIDHHIPRPLDPEAVGLRPGARLLEWQDPRCEATSLQIAAVVSQLAEQRRPLSSEAWADIALPCLVGSMTDTGSFTHPGADRTSLQLFKFLLESRFQGNLAAAREAVRWDLPEAAAALLSNPPRLDPGLAGPEAGGLAEEVASLIATGGGVREIPAPDEEVGLCLIPERIVELGVRVGQRAEPALNASDVLRELQRSFSGPLARRHPLAVTLIEKHVGSRPFVACTIRSWEPGLALDLALALGGGGHPRAAGATIPGSFTSVLREIERWVLHRKTAHDAAPAAAGP